MNEEKGNGYDGDGDYMREGGRGREGRLAWENEEMKRWGRRGDEVMKRRRSEKIRGVLESERQECS